VQRTQSAAANFGQLLPGLTHPNCTKSQRCKAQRATGRGRKGWSRGRTLRRGWVLGEGHWVPPRQLRSLGSACCKLPQQGSRQSRDSPMIFHCFGHWKMPLLNKKCDWTFVNWQYLAKNQTLHCPVWAENYDWTLTQKTGQSSEKPDTWQPYSWCWNVLGPKCPKSEMSQHQR